MNVQVFKKIVLISGQRNNYFSTRNSEQKPCATLMLIRPAVSLLLFSTLIQTSCLDKHMKIQQIVLDTACVKIGLSWHVWVKPW